MLMSLTMRSMAARMFCWVSVRCVTSMAESIPVLNRLAIAAITIRPSAMATDQFQQREAAFPILCLGIFMFTMVGPQRKAEISAFTV